MAVLFLISAGVTVFLVTVMILLAFNRGDAINTRLEEVASAETVTLPDLINEPRTGLARTATGLTDLFRPITEMISSSDDLEYRLVLAGFRRPEHVEIYKALKLLLPVAGVILGTFWRDNAVAGVLLGAILGFFGPDLVLSQAIKRRQESIRLGLPDALDLLVICMEAGLGMDQAIMRIGEEMTATCPPLAEEFQIITREQRAGKPRLEAWRSMAHRVDLEPVRQFVAMLVQTERFGTPIAHSLGQFADNMRVRRTQAAEEVAAKTGVKLLFPLILFIFPSIFVVTLGPAILNIEKMFQQLFSK